MGLGIFLHFKEMGVSRFVYLFVCLKVVLFLPQLAGILFTQVTSSVIPVL